MQNTITGPNVMMIMMGMVLSCRTKVPLFPSTELMKSGHLSSDNSPKILTMIFISAFGSVWGFRIIVRTVF